MQASFTALSKTQTEHHSLCMHCVLVCGDSGATISWPLSFRRLLCSVLAWRRAGTRGQGPGASCLLKGWATLPTVALWSSAHQHSEWRSEAGGLGQGRESEESWRLEATNQALRELAWQGRGPGHPKGGMGLRSLASEVLKPAHP